jgi:hypothetical protein
MWKGLCLLRPKKAAKQEPRESRKKQGGRLTPSKPSLQTSSLPVQVSLP